MGAAREAIDRMTAAMVNHDVAALAAAYAEDAVAVTPDEGEIKGREEIVRYLGTFLTAIPDFTWEPLAEHDSGDTSIDEGWVVGTNTGPMALPDGSTMPATGKAVRVRGCDIATVADGAIVRHHFYYDQMELLTQLGLAPEQG
ncbi:MAG TPA: nuclear transport factor 2 family protein [Acidimicrobiales bacterium]